MNEGKGILRASIAMCMVLAIFITFTGCKPKNNIGSSASATGNSSKSSSVGKSNTANKYITAGISTDLSKNTPPSATATYQNNEQTVIVDQTQQPPDLTSSPDATATIEPDPTPGPPDMRGNTSGNLALGGLVAADGEWIYFVNTVDKWTLYKVKTDGTGKTKILDESVDHLNVYGDWLYYSSYTEGNKIYRAKTDMTERTVLTDIVAGYVAVVNDQIYFTAKFEESKLYRMNLDGSGLTKLSDDFCAYVNVSGGYIFYVGFDYRYSRSQKLYRIRTDGTEKRQLCDFDVENLVVTGNRMYFSRYENAFGTTVDKLSYTALINGSHLTQLGTDLVKKINTDGDWMYYRNISDNDKLYRVGSDGTGRMKISDQSIDNFYIFGDRIYYHGPSGIMTMKTDGTDDRAL